MGNKVPLPCESSSAPSAVRGLAVETSRFMFLSLMAQESCFVAEVDAIARENLTGVRSSMFVHMFSGRL